MKTNAKVTMTALTVLLVVVLMSAAASALRSLSISGTGSGLEGRFRFAEERLGNSTAIICAMTLLGVTNSSIPKRALALLGLATEISIDVPRCTTGESITRVDDVRGLRAVETLTSQCRTTAGVVKCAILWPTLYEAILGTLPLITGSLFKIESVGISFTFRDVLNIRHVCVDTGALFMLSEVNAERRLGNGQIVLILSRLTGRLLEGFSCSNPVAVAGNYSQLSGFRLTLV